MVRQAFEVAGEAGFLRFPLQRLVRREEQVLHELLRDGRRALDRAAGAGVGEEGADDGPHVDAGVFAEAAVFGADEGVDHVARYVGGFHGAAVTRTTDGDRFALGVDEFDGGFAVERPQRRLVRQGRHLGEQRVPEQGEGHEADSGCRADDFENGRAKAHQQAGGRRFRRARVILVRQGRTGGRRIWSVGRHIQIPPASSGRRQEVRRFSALASPSWEVGRGSPSSQ